MRLFDQDWFQRIRRPSRYLGDEINIIKKDLHHVEISVALAFPDVYEVGMSHLGLKILYHLLNQKSWLAAERVFAPWVDLEKQLRFRNIRLAALESDRPLSEFDIVGFSLQHELSYTNVLNMLDLAQLPLLSRDRNQHHPLIIAGGPACFNPEPMAPIFDLMVIGDGEETTLEICSAVRKAKGRGMFLKEDIFPELMSIQGVYIPSLYDIHYRPEGTISQIEFLPGPPSQAVKKAIVPDLDAYGFPVTPLVPYAELIHDRLTQEIARGCTRGCRFCQAGMIYRPVRERRPERILKYIEQALPKTGFEEISLLSLSAGDYSCLKPLLQALMDKHARTRTAVSLPSLRIDSMDPDWFDQLKKVRKTGFTLAPEVGSDRLRRAINKPLTNQEILQTAQSVYQAGWKLIKLYFMIGLPEEKEEDLEAIINLARDVSRMAGQKGKKPNLNISLAVFVPKSHTPFAWCTQMPLPESRTKIQIIRQALDSRAVQVKWNQPEMSWLEGIFARGDRRLTSAIIEAWRIGARFDAWGEHLKLDLWERAFEKTGLDPNFYLQRPRGLEEIFPWEHIHTGVSREYLRAEWLKTGQGIPTTDCRNHCLDCGVCDFKSIEPKIAGTWPREDERTETGRTASPADRQDKKKIYDLFFTKCGKARYLSHLELMRLFQRAFRRAGLPLAFSAGYHPLPKFSFHSALPVGLESLSENMRVELVRPVSLPEAVKDINAQLLDGIQITHMEQITDAQRKRVTESHYSITLSNHMIKSELLDEFHQLTQFFIKPTGAKNRGETDIKPFIHSLEQHSSHEIRMILKHLNGLPPNPALIISNILHLDENGVEAIKVLKTRQVIG